MTTKLETAVRVAATALHAAIAEAHGAGLTVAWPRRFEDLPAIAISETRKTRAAVVAATPAEAPPVSAAKTAQKPADKVVDNA